MRVRLEPNQARPYTVGSAQNVQRKRQPCDVM